MVDKTPRMLAIEREFGGDIRDIIADLREIDGGNTWRTVAGCLGVGERTLLEWRHRLEMDVSAHEQKYDPTSYADGKHPSHLDHRAQALGYGTAREAVYDLRVNKGLTRVEAGEVLSCHESTVYLHTPEHVRGTVYNRSDAWYAQRRSFEQGTGHPWRGQFDAVFRG